MMKKITYLLVLLITVSLSAQKSFTFDYKLNYKLVENDQSVIFTTHYLSTKKSTPSIVNFPFYSRSKSDYLFVSGEEIVPIKAMDLENNFTIEMPNERYYYSEKMEFPKEMKFMKFEGEPMTVLNRTCTPYQLYSREDKGEEFSPSEFIFCVDETSEIDNFSKLFSNQKNTNIKGLILAITSDKYTDEDEQLLLSDISKINSTIHLDFENEFATYKAKVDSIQRERGAYEAAGAVTEAADAVADAAQEAVAVGEYYNGYMAQPNFCNNYYYDIYNLKLKSETSTTIASNYIYGLCQYTYSMERGDEEKYKSFALREIKNSTKNMVKTGLMSKDDSKILYEYLKKDIEELKQQPISAVEVATAETAVDAVGVEVAADYVVDAAVDAPDIYVWEYEPGYQSKTYENTNLAINNIEPESTYWKGMPTYCKKIDEIIPNFSDAELVKHAHNYAGQICDMYMGEFEAAGVWYKGTLDAIRAEQLYFENNKDNFSKKDKKLLNEFLNSLD